MTPARVGWNGRTVEEREAVISVYDHGFLYGLGLFETFRTYGGKPYLLNRHLERLQGGCAELGIRFAMSAEQVEEWTRRLLEENGLADGYVRLTVSAGEGALGLPTGDYEQPNALLLVKELPPANDDALMRGRELRLLQTRRNTPEGSVRFKSLHYMNSIIAKRELMGFGGGDGSAQGPGASGEAGRDEGLESETSEQLVHPPTPGAEGLQLTREGWLAEGIVSNLFFLKGGVVRTPSLDTGILPGVTRRRVLELAYAAGYPVEEGMYRWEDLLQADEAWMTNSIQELVPITTLSDNSGSRAVVSGGQAGPVVRKLLALYREDTLRPR
ncbi:aminotransferase class IV [Paenibacillus soyae]|uniref:Aminotransferase class IV n=1 Tax=Paenibacillus soyae TaxID=2969249 RepID=A0A9X2SDL7_9BACL|nr:aminotransferase class IV [Paenibacillus soyae]MCR2807247.1 aminotransferase class IV [Paenibacillus soyae]